MSSSTQKRGRPTSRFGRTGLYLISSIISFTQGLAQPSFADYSSPNGVTAKISAHVSVGGMIFSFFSTLPDSFSAKPDDHRSPSKKLTGVRRSFFADLNPVEG